MRSLPAEMSEVRRRAARLLVPAVALAAALLVPLVLPALAHAAAPTIVERQYVTPTQDSTTTTVQLSKPVNGQDVLFVAVACSRCVSNGVLPNSVTVTDSLGTTFLDPASNGASVQDARNNISVQIFLGSAPKNGSDTITVSGNAVELVDVVHIVGSHLSDPMVVDTGGADCSVVDCSNIGTFANSDISGGAFALLVAEGNGDTSSCSVDGLDANNFTLAPYCGQKRWHVPVPTPASQTVYRGGTVSINGQAPTEGATVWGGSELFNSLLTDNLVVDLNAAGGSMVYASVALDPPEHGAKSRAAAKRPARPAKTLAVSKRAATRAPGGNIPSFSYQWLEQGPGSSSYVNATNCVDPHALTCTFVTNTQTVLGDYSFKLQVTDPTSGARTISFPVTVTVRTLAFTSSTTDLPSGSTRTLTVEIRGAGGQVVTGDSSTVVTLAQTGGTGSVRGLGSATASHGVVLKTIAGSGAGPVTISASVGGL